MNTIQKLQAHLDLPVRKYRGYEIKPQSAAVMCADGSTMSVQASKFHYCTPRNDFGPYTYVEVWRCGSPEQWAEYGDGSVPYAYIPIELVAEEIDRRGGMLEVKK